VLAWSDLLEVGYSGWKGGNGRELKQGTGMMRMLGELGSCVNRRRRRGRDNCVALTLKAPGKREGSMSSDVGVSRPPSSPRPATLTLWA
jgi:hypothetical protein